MKGACSSCGEDPGFDWAICPQCGNTPDGSGRKSEPVGDRWDRTIIEPEATPIPKSERARFVGRGDFYTPVGGGFTEAAAPTVGAWNSPAAGAASPGGAGGRMPDHTILDHNRGFYGGDGADHTIIDRHRVGDDDQPVEDGTVIIKGGRKAIEGPLVYFVQRNGIRSGKVHLLAEETAIGRNADQDIILGDETVSKRHAKVKREDGRFIFWDLASSNHSYILGPNGQRTRIYEPHTLTDGDTLELGDARLTYIEVDTGAQD